MRRPREGLRICSRRFVSWESRSAWVLMLAGASGMPAREKCGLGRAVLGGLIAATAATLLILPAVRRLLGRLGWRIEDVDLWEINEAFAAMVLSVLHELPEVDPGRVNPHGGAIAYGHPLGASMPRVIVDVCRHLRARGGGRGIAAACVGVGQGMAVAVEV